MDTRSDWALELQLSQTRAQAVHENVTGAIQAVIDHMTKGHGKNRRGGASLVHLLESARSAAASMDEWQTVRHLQDALDYAEGRLLRLDFEERHQLTGSGTRDERDLDLYARTKELMYQHAAGAAREMLEQRPQSSGEDMVAYFETMSREARFLEAPRERPGWLRILRGRAEVAAWVERTLKTRIDVENLDEAVRRIVVSPESLQQLAAAEQGRALFAAAQRRRRQLGLADLRGVAEDRTTVEQELQNALQEQHWIFGERFAGEEALRTLVPGEEITVPLIRADGALHVVVVRPAMGLVGGLVTYRRDALVLTREVHHAVSQAMDYLVGLGESGQEIREQFGIDVHRASVTVLVGHPDLHPDLPEEVVGAALGAVNVQLNRVEVRTYKDLLDSAEHSLQAVEPS
jgi:hypothetical protein